MGCGNSKTVTEKTVTDNVELRKHRIVRETWAVIEKDLETHAIKW